MTSEEAFLQTILAEPRNDVPRLAYADWLEERDDPRGEFIRVQCELAKLLQKNPFCADVEMQDRQWWMLEDHVKEWQRAQFLKDREKTLLHATISRIANSIFPKAYVHYPLLGKDYDCVIVTSPPDRMVLSIKCRRGFIADVECRADCFLRYGTSLTRVHPVEKVSFSSSGPSLFSLLRVAPPELLHRMDHHRYDMGVVVDGDWRKVQHTVSNNVEASFPGNFREWICKQLLAQVWPNITFAF